MNKFLIILALTLTAIAGCSPYSQEHWCFIGIHREFLCHQTQEACVSDWHARWDSIIHLGYENPLTCAPLSDWQGGNAGSPREMQD
jgi:hypothetical protein